MSPYHLGINIGHDRAAALVKDGDIAVAISQERLDRNKHSVGFLHHAVGDESQVQLPDEAIRYCLDSVGINYEDLGSITANMPGEDHSAAILNRKLAPELLKKVKIIPSHHLAHAYTAYWPSGFDEALVMVVDASGSTDAQRKTESYSLYRAQGTELVSYHDEKVDAHLAGLSTLGFIYEYVTRKANFASKTGPTLTIPEAGKLMGLAPYGGPQEHWHRWIKADAGELGLSMSAYDIFLEFAALEKRYDDGEGKAYLRPYLVDLAWKVQHELEEALLHVVGEAVRATGLRKLCLAGGVALNSVANYKLLRKLALDDIFIFPAAGDAGIAAGCAYWAYATQEEGRQRPILHRADLGHAYDRASLKQAVEKFSDRIEVHELDDNQALQRTAQALAKGSIVARYDGGSEFGPRALGHRSILADPTFEKMKDIINARVKFREAFRPFAPVIPEESVTEVFEQTVAAPFMLLISHIKDEYHHKIPAVTHYDGTGRVQTVTDSANPFMHKLCRQMVEERQGPPVVLNTSFNVAGQPIVETPEEAIETFLSADIDYLCLENYWIVKRDEPVLNYDEHLSRVTDSPLPRGLAPGQPAVTELMRRLDRALFFGETEGCPWSDAELARLSAQGGRYKETSRLFKENPFGANFKTRLSDDVVIVLNPLGQSRLVDLSNRVETTKLKLEDIECLLALFNNDEEQLERLRIAQQASTLEWAQRIESSRALLQRYRLESAVPTAQVEMPDTSLNETVSETFAAFIDTSFSARQALAELRQALLAADYSEQAICRLLDVESMQQIEPTRLHYYDKYKLGETALADLTRLFLLRAALPRERIVTLLGEANFLSLSSLGLFIERDGQWASRVDLYYAEGLFIATDHRYMLLEEDRIGESPVMYIGLDSIGLVHTAPRAACGQVLDLCTGSGIQALIASRYAHEVTAVDLNPRAIRFARFNAQLNGIDNLTVLQGDLYSVVGNRRFDVILANPPFVPSPWDELRFRDGGKRGEGILSRIIAEAQNYLSADGKLHIVTDLVDVKQYENKLRRWWQGGEADMLVLHTADRDDILFSVPHCHAPFAQSFADYNAELERWLVNFHQADLTAVNFGYIMIHRLNNGEQGSYFAKTIHSPVKTIHDKVQSYFAQRSRLQSSERSNYLLQMAADIRLRIELDPNGSHSHFEAYSSGNPFYSTYVLSEEVFQGLQAISQHKPQVGAFVTEFNQHWVEDLLHKGILEMVEDRRRAGRQDEWNQAAENVVQMIFKKRRKMRDHAPAQQTVEELETKTTPPCLSSYIGQ